MSARAKKACLVLAAVVIFCLGYWCGYWHGRYDELTMEAR